MTPIAPLVTSFLRDWLPAHRGASRHTIDSYSYALRLLFLFVSERLKIPPSAIAGALAWLVWGLVSYGLLRQPVWL